MAAGQVVLHEAFILRNTTEPQDLPKSLAGHVHSFNIIVAEARTLTHCFCGRCLLTAPCSCLVRLETMNFSLVLSLRTLHNGWWFARIDCSRPPAQS